MPPVRAERWFHTLVVAGASLAGCGGETSEKPAPAVSSSGGVPGTGGTATGGVSSAGLGGGSLVSPAATKCVIHASAGRCWAFRS